MRRQLLRIPLLLLPALGCPSSDGDSNDAADDVADAAEEDRPDGAEAADEAADEATEDATEVESDGDPGETRELHPVVLLGEGGFFGTSGETLDGLLDSGELYGIGAHHADISDGSGEPVQAGRLYLFESGPPPSDVADAVAVLEPPDGAAAAGGGFAYAAAGPCDFDADGHPDLAVGNHLWGDAATPISGRVVVFWGDPAGGLSATRVTTHTLSDGLRARNDVLGQTVLCGDFDGDTFDDLLAAGQNGGPDDTGIAAFFDGSSSGLPARESSTLVAPVRENAQYLGSVGLWTDLDGDGDADLALGGWGLIKGGRIGDPHTGGVLVYDGGADWALGPSYSLFPEGSEAVQAGTSLALADAGSRLFLAVGAPDWGAPSPTGGVLVWDAGRVGFHESPPVSVLVPPAGTSDVGFGHALAWIPDFLGRDRGALLVGMQYADCGPGAVGTGAVAVFVPSADGSSFEASADLLCAPAPAPNDAFGSAILPLSDLDADGLRDFLVGMESHLEGDPLTGTQTGGVVFFL